MIFSLFFTMLLHCLLLCKLSNWSGFRFYLYVNIVVSSLAFFGWHRFLCIGQLELGQCIDCLYR